MNYFIIFFTIPVLAFLKFIFSIQSQKLYDLVYSQHVILEPVIPSSKIISQHKRAFLTDFFLLPLLPLFIIGQQEEGLAPIFFTVSDILCGILIGYLIVPLSRAIFSTLFFWYLKKHSHLVTGKLVFKQLATTILQITLTIQSFILCGVITCLIPSAFLVGICISIALCIPFFLFNKHHQPII